MVTELEDHSMRTAKDRQPGEALASVLRRRCQDVALEEAAELAHALLRLAELGLLVPVSSEPE